MTAKTKEDEGKPEDRPKTGEIEYLPFRVSSIDQLINCGGMERASTILVSGGCGSGKTIFAMQSIYNAALHNEKSIYFTLEEEPEKIRAHMKKNFGWDIEEMEKRGLIAIIKMDPIELAWDIENTLKNPDNRKIFSYPMQPPTALKFDGMTIDMPFRPDRIVLDSQSVLNASFIHEENYRLYIKTLVKALNQHNSANIILSETEQEPMLYSKAGVEEFVTDGVIVLYNIRKGQLRRRALEIVKLRHSDHMKEMVPFMITDKGIKILEGEKVY